MYDELGNDINQQDADIMKDIAGGRTKSTMFKFLN